MGGRRVFFPIEEGTEIYGSYTVTKGVKLEVESGYIGQLNYAPLRTLGRTSLHEDYRGKGQYFPGESDDPHPQGRLQEQE